MIMCKCHSYTKESQIWERTLRLNWYCKLEVRIISLNTPKNNWFRSVPFKSDHIFLWFYDLTLLAIWYTQRNGNNMQKIKIASFECQYTIVQLKLQRKSKPYCFISEISKKYFLAHHLFSKPRMMNVIVVPIVFILQQTMWH